MRNLISSKKLIVILNHLQSKIPDWWISRCYFLAPGLWFVEGWAEATYDGFELIFLVSVLARFCCTVVLFFPAVLKFRSCVSAAFLCCCSSCCVFFLPCMLYPTTRLARLVPNVGLLIFVY